MTVERLDPPRLSGITLERSVKLLAELNAARARRDAAKIAELDERLEILDRNRGYSRSKAIHYPRPLASSIEDRS